MRKSEKRESKNKRGREDGGGRIKEEEQKMKNWSRKTISRGNGEERERRE